VTMKRTVRSSFLCVAAAWPASSSLTCKTCQSRTCRLEPDLTLSILPGAGYKIANMLISCWLESADAIMKTVEMIWDGHSCLVAEQ
jgi:hypothetical protein